MSDTEEATREILYKIQTTGSIPISPQLFEQLYLAPKSHVKGQLRQTFGNPTPIALGGLLLCATPLSMVMFGWLGSGGFAAAANVGSYFYLGGVLLILGAIGEWILGNTFPATIFSIFGGFWSTLGATIVPGNGAYGLYSANGTSDPLQGLQEPAFFATFGFLLMTMTLVCVIFAIASIRTNVVFFSTFVLLSPGFGCLTAWFFALSNGSPLALTFQRVGAGFFLAVSILGWYIFLSLILLSVDFPLVLPVGDLSTVVPGRSKRMKRVDSFSGC
ncbi:GPR1/FUN34/yaaH family-domain-containing protein [Dactylonectria macrodidyma]|uniref:GPR1/FUN34/yaaH family-domain-containing protein n=1 Tax=Dactylonectria macrodidyma TaxID=307937 RepID=A0A9P9DQF0_9HYPO|nr:GPR1/FUN34/yaaH family-domain-containing protein [Dactylonectria macrodidyma]